MSDSLTSFMIDESFRIADSYFIQSKIKDAYDAYKFIWENQKSERCLKELVLCCRILGYHQILIDYVEEGLENFEISNKKKIFYLYVKADCHLHLKQYDKLFPLICKLIEKNSDKPYPWYLKSRYLYELNDYKTCLCYLSKALDIDPTHQQSYILQIKVYCLLNRTDEALNIHIKARKYLDALSNSFCQGIISQYNRKYRTAITCFRTVINDANHFLSFESFQRIGECNIAIINKSSSE